MILHKHRSYFRFVLLTCIVLSPSFIRAQSFEGEITMQMSSPMLGNQKIDIFCSVKGDKISQTADDPHQGKTTIYTDTKAGVQVIVQEALKQGMQIDQAVVDEAVKKMNMPPMVPKKGGKEEMISGYNAELYTMMIDSAEEMSIWLTKGLPKDIAGAIRNCVNAGINFTGVKSDALMEMFKAGYAPVRFEMKQGDPIGSPCILDKDRKPVAALAAQIN